MLGKREGRMRVHRMLAKSGYGKSGSVHVASGASSQLHKSIKQSFAAGGEVKGKKTKARLDRKSRS